jgi:redox-sensitive bicupin YhaK (pirin superfamily)
LLELAQTRHAWMPVASGSANVNGRMPASGDGAPISEESRILIGHGGAAQLADVLVFDLRDLRRPGQVSAAFANATARAISGSTVQTSMSAQDPCWG